MNSNRSTVIVVLPTRMNRGAGYCSPSRNAKAEELESRRRSMPGGGFIWQRYGAEPGPQAHSPFCCSQDTRVVALCMKKDDMCIMLTSNPLVTIALPTF